MHCSFTCSSSSAAVCYSCGQGQQKGPAEARAELSDVWMRFNRQLKKPLNKSQHTTAHGQGSSAAGLCQGAASRAKCNIHEKLGRCKSREGAGSWVPSQQQEPGLSCTAGVQFCSTWDIKLHWEAISSRPQKIHSNHVSHTCLIHHPSHITRDCQEIRRNSGLPCFLQKTEKYCRLGPTALGL